MLQFVHRCQPKNIDITYPNKLDPRKLNSFMQLSCIKDFNKLYNSLII